MGLCILFPHLCGLRSTRIAEMKQIALPIITDMEAQLEAEPLTGGRMMIIERARGNAVAVLAKAGYNPYD